MAEHALCLEFEACEANMVKDGLAMEDSPVLRVCPGHGDQQIDSVHWV